MLKLFIMIALCVLGTLILACCVLFYDPPAFIAYGFGVLNGASIIGIIATWIIRHERNNN